MMRKLCRLLVGLVICNLVFGVSAHAIGLSTATIDNSGTRKYKGFMLPYEFYSLAEPDFSDVQILDSEGNSVPYFINKYEKSANPVTASYGLIATGTTEEEAVTYYSFEVPANYPADASATSISLTADNSRFAKTVEIQGFDINGNMVPLRRGTVYRVDDKSNDTIKFNKPENTRRFRVRVPNTDQQVKITGATIHYSEEFMKEAQFIQSRDLSCKLERENYNFVIFVKGIKNLTVDRMTIDSTTIFKKMADYGDGRTKELFLQPIHEESKEMYSDFVLPFDRTLISEDEFSITIQNEDAFHDLIGLNRVTVDFYVDEIIFEAEPDETYTLSFNDPNHDSPPAYSIEGLKEQIFSEGYDVVKLSALQTPQTEMPARDTVEANHTTGIVVATAIIIAILIFIWLFNDRLRQPSSYK